MKKYETEYGVLYLEDSRNTLKYVDENSVDLIYTDPPYGIDYEKYGLSIKRGNEHVRFGKDDNIEWANNFPYWAIPIFSKVLKEDRWGVVWHAIDVTSFVREEIERNGLRNRNTIVWYKYNSAPTPRKNFKNEIEMATVFTKGRTTEKWRGNPDTGNVFKHSFVTYGEWKEGGGHPSIKPMGLVGKHIPLFTDEGDTVLDMFVGSGTVPVVCEIFRRRWIGFEKDEKWYNVAVERLKKYRNRRLDEWW